MAVINKILGKFKIKNKIFVGNRKLLNEIFDEQGIKKNKEQILREIDKLDKLPIKQVKQNLTKLKAGKILSILTKPESYFQKYKTYSEIQELKKYCAYYGIKIIFQPSLVRGLSYYNGNIFEVKTTKVKESICGGGSYQINNIQATGISFSLERFSKLTGAKSIKESFLVISLNQNRDAIKLAEKLREQGQNTSIFYGKPSKALEYANAKKIDKVIFVGKKEITSGKFKVKDMITGNESVL